MRTHIETTTITTSGPYDLVDVTEEVRAVARGASVAEGRAIVVARSEGCSLFINEREAGLLSDIRATMLRLRSEGREHLGTLLGSRSLVVPIIGGDVRLGTWQRMLLAELGGPSTHTLAIHMVGE